MKHVRNFLKFAGNCTTKTTIYLLNIVAFHTYGLVRKDTSVIKGKDRGTSIKEKYRISKREKLCSDHPEHIKTRKLAQHSKKLDCPVTFTVKKIYLFPEYKIVKDTKWNRTTAAKKIKHLLSEIKERKKDKDQKQLSLMHMVILNILQNFRQVYTLIHLFHKHLVLLLLTFVV